jgi:hypothetical protein
MEFETATILFYGMKVFYLIQILILWKVIDGIHVVEEDHLLVLALWMLGEEGFHLRIMAKSFLCWSK